MTWDVYADSLERQARICDGAARRALYTAGRCAVLGLPQAEGYELGRYWRWATQALDLRAEASHVRRAVNPNR
jgi:hypothetical protein